eukprot:7292636-Prymnesium_polylepis.1
MEERERIAARIEELHRLRRLAEALGNVESLLKPPAATADGDEPGGSEVAAADEAGRLLSASTEYGR